VIVTQNSIMITLSENILKKLS